MDCQVCGNPLPAEAKACPNCGALTPTYYANAGASTQDPTLLAVSGSSPHAMNSPSPSTQYGSSPYEVSLQSPYDINPYTAPPPPLPPRPPRKASPIMLGTLLVLLLLIVGAGVGFVFISNNVSHTNNTNPTTTVVVQNFTANGTFTIVSRTTKSFRQDGQNKIYSTIQQEVDYGDITGSFTVEETLILHPDNTGTFSGSSTCTCTIAGKSGILMWSYTGTSTADGSYQGQTFDVHGTGDLAKLHGQGVFQGQGLHGTYSSENHFDS